MKNAVHNSLTGTDVADWRNSRQKINRINTDLVQAVADTAPERTTPTCRPELTVAVIEVHHEKHPDLLHTKALVRSLASVCRN